MPEITKSGAKLHLFIVTHKYTDLYFIFFFQQPTPGRQANLGLRLYNRPSAVASPHRPPSPIGLRIHIVRHPSAVASQSDCANGAIHRHRRKTAEERFNMLARGWLAYPVTSMHAHLPPKSGCRNIIPRFALSRRRATALFRNPVRKAQRSVPGFSSTPNSACRRYATSPPSIGLRIPFVRHHHLIAPTAQYTAIGRNRRRAV